MKLEIDPFALPDLRFKGYWQAPRYGKYHFVVDRETVCGKKVDDQSWDLPLKSIPAWWKEKKDELICSHCERDLIWQLERMMR